MVLAGQVSRTMVDPCRSSLARQRNRPIECFEKRLKHSEIFGVFPAHETLPREGRSAVPDGEQVGCSDFLIELDMGVGRRSFLPGVTHWGFHDCLRRRIVEVNRGEKRPTRQTKEVVWSLCSSLEGIPYSLLETVENILKMPDLHMIFEEVPGGIG